MNQSTNIQNDGMKLCETLKIKPDQLKFILNCFYELKFITMNHGIIEINKDAGKMTYKTHRYIKQENNK